MRARFAFLLALLLGCASAIAAEPDLSSPKAAAKSLFNAVNANDRDAIRACFFAADARQSELAAAMADLIANGRRLGDAARERFGKAGDPIGRGMLDPSDLGKIDAAAVTETGDVATLFIPGQQRPMTFRKQDGKWRLSIADFGGAAPDNIDKQIKLVRLMADAMDTSAKELSAAQYKTVDEAILAIQQRLHAVMLTVAHPATTRAATTTAATTRP